MNGRKESKEAFLTALEYLMRKGYTYRYIAKVLTEIGKEVLVKPAYVEHTKVYYWHKNKRVPHSEGLILLVTRWAAIVYRRACFLNELNAALDKIRISLPDAIDYLRDSGYSWRELRALTWTEDERPACTETIKRWQKGHKPKEVKRFLGRKMPEGIPNPRIARIKGKYAAKTGKREAALFAVHSVFERYKDLFITIPREKNDWDWEKLTEWAHEYGRHHLVKS